ncbi:MAG: ATP-binding protein [Betaproteobacteria bacterium]
MFAQQSREHAIVLLDREGRVTWWSPGAREIFGHAPEEILGEPSACLFTAEDVDKGMDRLEFEVAEVDNTAQDDRWMRRADGSRFWASGILLAVRDAKGDVVGYAKVLRNRTDLREQIDALRNQLRELESASHRKDVFLSTLSHELRNPLAPLANALQIIRFSVAPGADLEYALRVIERQMELLRRLVDDLLDLSRVGAGKIELERRLVALAGIVRQAVESVRAAAAQRRHALDVVLPDDPMTLEADADRLHQVLVNLLNNAVKYTPEGGHIWVHATTEGDEAVVHVRDNGVGIPSDMLPGIFDLFTQVDAAREHSQGGLGIGLSLVKNLVALHGGSVQVRSDGEGKGSEFTVRLPLHRATG